MHFDDLGEAWRAGVEPPHRSPGDDLAATLARADRLDRIVRRRDRLETGTALLLLPLFAWLAFRTPHPVSAMGAAIVAVACVGIPIRLHLARRVAPDPALPTAEAVPRALARIRAQQRLLNSVAWWYLAPLGVGVVMFVAGSPAAPWFKIGYALLTALGLGLLLHLNRRAVRRELAPVARDLEQWLAGLDDPMPEGAPDAS